jgi:predicted transposase YbfD/YdcC
LRQRFSQLPDTRQPGKVLHRLDEVLLCAFCAIVCDAESYTDMEDFAESQLAWLRGATVTIDAIGAQSAIAAQIHEAGADDVLALKANQGGAHQATAAAFGDTPAAAPEPGQPALPAPPHPGVRLCERLELSHGRCEKREYQLLGDLGWFAKSWKWAGLQAVGKVRREVRRGRDGEAQIEQHYFLCSFKDNVERFAALVRGHWSVENRCHWVLDVTFGEDHCQVRDRSAAHNFSLLRELALKALRDHPDKLSLRRIRRRAALDPDFRPQILAQLHA